MVYFEYLSYQDMYINIIARHIMKFCYPINPKRRFVILSKIIEPAIKLLYKFAELKYDYTNIIIVPTKYINDKECIEFCEDEILQALYHLMGTYRINKSDLYAVTNYVIANYKPDNEFEDKIYKSISLYQNPINKCLKSIPNNTLESAIKNTRNLNTLLSTFLINLPWNFVKAVWKIEEEKRFNDIFRLCVTAAFVMFPQNLIYNYNLRFIELENENITIDKNNLEEECRKYIFNWYSRCITFKSHPKNVSFYTYEDKMLLEKYDKNYDSKNAISLYGSFINVLEDLDKVQLHKFICKGIDNKEIILENKGVIKKLEYKYWQTFYSLTSEDGLANLLFYYVSKHIPLTEIYEIGYDSYAKVSLLIMENDKTIKNMFIRELNFIKRHFKFSLIDGYTERILIFNPVYKFRTNHEM